MYDEYWDWWQEYNSHKHQSSTSSFRRGMNIYYIKILHAGSSSQQQNLSTATNLSLVFDQGWERLTAGQVAHSDLVAAFSSVLLLGFCRKKSLYKSLQKSTVLMMVMMNSATLLRLYSQSGTKSRFCIIQRVIHAMVVIRNMIYVPGKHKNRHISSVAGTHEVDICCMPVTRWSSWCCTVCKSPAHFSQWNEFDPVR